MPNHYTNIVIAQCAHHIEDPDEFDLDAALTEWATDMLDRLLPPPQEVKSQIPHVLSDAEYDWRLKNHGTKWCTYNIAKPVGIPGDCFASMISFCTAWSAPCEEIIRLAIADAKTRGLHILSWTGLDPYDDTAHNLFTRDRKE